MNSFAFFEEIVSHIEDMQQTINQLRDLVKAKISECTSPKEDKPNE